jgi:hypothetical protein
VRQAFAVKNKGAAALDAHTGAAKRFSHFSQSAGAVFQTYGQISHCVVILTFESPAKVYARFSDKPMAVG